MGAIVDTVAPGPMVGRDGERRVVGEAIRRAAGGQAQVVAICGESGIGKSRLAKEALQSAGGSGFRALESAAGRLHRDLSYAPIVAALRPLTADAALVTGLSDLARLFDGLQVPPLVPLGDPGLERTRMFEAVRRLVERASARAPLAILIDDLHWADPATVALLHYVVRALPRQRFLLLLTYRADKADEDLTELLTALQRADMLTLVELAGLDAAAVGDLAAPVLGGPAPAARGGGDEIDGAQALAVLIAATRADLDRRAGVEAGASARAGLDLARRLDRPRRSTSWRVPMPRRAGWPAGPRRKSPPGGRRPSAPEIRGRGRGG